MTADEARQARRERNRVVHENRNLPAVLNRETKVKSLRDERNGERNSRRIGAAIAIGSIGLGIAEILAPRLLSRVIGIRQTAATSTVMRVCGVREIVVGLGMLVQPQRALWAWARVAEDALDVALLYSMTQSRGNNRALVSASMALTTGALALDALRAVQLNAQNSVNRPRLAPKALRTGTSLHGSALP
jgi:uncharacterized membrane protein